MSAREGWVAALLRLYPARWRARYGDELAELVAQSRFSGRLVRDLLGGAIDAHLNLADLMGGWSAMTSRLRASVITVFTGWVVFCAAACGLVKGIEDGELDRAAHADAALGASLVALRWAFALAGVAVLVGAAPLVLVALRRAWRDAALARLCAVPFLAATVVIGYALVAVSVAGGAQPAGGSVSAGRAVLFVGLLVLCATGAVSTVVAVRAAVHRIELPAPALRWAGWASALVAVTVTVGVASTAVYGWLLATESPALLRSAKGLVATPLPATLAVVLALGAAAVVIVGRAAVTGLRALCQRPA